MLSAAHKLTDSNSHQGCVIKTNNADGKFWFPDGHAAKGWLLGVRHLWTEFWFNQDPRRERSNNRAPWRKCRCFCLFNDQYPLLWASLVTQMVNNLPAMQEIRVQSLGQEDPVEKGMATHSSILAWRIPGLEEPGWDTLHGGAKSRI